MTFIYTRSQLKSRVNAKIQGRIGMLVDANETMNEGIRRCYSQVDVRSARRKASLSPKLFKEITDYACPSDLMGYKIIDIPAQAKRSDGSFNLIPTEQFTVKRQKGDIAIDDYNGTRVLKIDAEAGGDGIVIAELDAVVSGGGTWSAFGDGQNLAADSDDYIKGNGSLKFGISSAAGTTAGIQASALTAFDLTDYLGGSGAVFVWHKINSATDITNYILRIGTDSSNYYQKTITTQHDGTAFVAGWNLLRFDLTSLSQTGTPTDTNTKYVVLYMTKATTKVSETDYKFDWLVLKSGEIHEVQYYSKYGWQTTSTYAYKENSTADTDLLVADTDEFELLVDECAAVAAEEIELPETLYNRIMDNKEKHRGIYQMNNPSEVKVMTSEYYRY